MLEEAKSTVEGQRGATECLEWGWEQPGKVSQSKCHMSWGLKDEKEVIALEHAGMKAGRASYPSHLIWQEFLLLGG